MVSRYAGTAQFTEALLDRGAHLTVYFLRGHLLLEQALTTIIELRGDRARTLVDRASFSAKLTLCDGLGLIDEDLASTIRQVNRERNRLAHRLDASLDAESVEALASRFTPALQEAVRDIVELTPPGSDRTSELINAVFLLLSLGLARVIQKVRYESTNRQALEAYRLACAIADVQDTGVTHEQIAKRLGVPDPPNPADALGELFIADPGDA